MFNRLWWRVTLWIDWNIGLSFTFSLQLILCIMLWYTDILVRRGRGRAGTFKPLPVPCTRLASPKSAVSTAYASATLLLMDRSLKINESTLVVCNSHVISRTMKLQLNFSVLLVIRFSWSRHRISNGARCSILLAAFHVKIAAFFKIIFTAIFYAPKYKWDGQALYTLLISDFISNMK